MHPRFSLFLLLFLFSVNVQSHRLAAGTDPHDIILQLEEGETDTHKLEEASKEASSNGDSDIQPIKYGLGVEDTDFPGPRETGSRFGSYIGSRTSVQGPNFMIPSFRQNQVNKYSVPSTTNFLNLPSLTSQVPDPIRISQKSLAQLRKGSCIPFKFTISSCLLQSFVFLAYNIDHPYKTDIENVFGKATPAGFDDLKLKFFDTEYKWVHPDPRESGTYPEGTHPFELICKKDLRFTGSNIGKESDDSSKTELTISKLNPHQLLRLFTYQLSHQGIIHIGSNLLITILSGISIESVHGFLRTCIIYNSGVILGGLSHGIKDPCVALVGSSGGAYTLLGILVADVALNWRTKAYRKKTLAIAIMFMILDIVNTYVSSGSGNQVSYAAHAGGFLWGLFFGYSGGILNISGHGGRCCGDRCGKILCGTQDSKLSGIINTIMSKKMVLLVLSLSYVIYVFNWIYFGYDVNSMEYPLGLGKPKMTCGKVLSLQAE